MFVALPFNITRNKQVSAIGLIVHVFGACRRKWETSFLDSYYHKGNYLVAERARNENELANEALVAGHETRNYT